MYKQQNNNFSISIEFFYSCVAVFVATSFWIIQIYGTSNLVDLFNLFLLLLCGILFLVDKKTTFLLAILCGYLVSSTQGLTFQSGIKDGAIVTGTITSLILSALLIVKIGKFSKFKINLLTIFLFVPIIFGIFSYLLNDYIFIYSEAKKFFIFFVFLAVAFGCHHHQNLLLLKITANATLAVTILSIFAYFVLQTSYSYSGIYYPIIPVAIVIIPLVYIFNRNPLFLRYTIFIAVLALAGLIQPSAKIIILLGFVVIIELKNLSRTGAFIVIFAISFLSLGLIELENFDNNMRHKVLTLLSSGDAILGLISSGTVDNAYVFFRTSVGNILAEFVTVFGSLIDTFLLPPGVGFSIKDTYGWLSMANDAAYHPLSGPDSIYPMHLGIYYILIWFGPFIIFFRNYFKEVNFFMAAFILFSLSTPTLILLSSILTNNNGEIENETD